MTKQPVLGGESTRGSHDLHTAEGRVAFCRLVGLEAVHDTDPPDYEYKEHAHERTQLFTLGGSLLLRRAGMPDTTLLPGSEAVVGPGQLHSGTVGPDGWEYVAAFDPQEAKLYEH